MKNPPSAIILAARGIPTLPHTSGNPFETSIEWILKALQENGIEDISIIGGKHIEDIGKKSRGITYFYQPNWEQAGMMETLMLAREKLKGPCIISYADIVCRPELIRKLLEGMDDMTLICDETWQTRYPNRNEKLIHTKAEKVWWNAGASIQKIRKNAKSLKTVSGEYIGVCALSEKAGKAFLDLYDKSSKKRGSFHEAKSVDRAFLTDFLQEWIDQGNQATALAIQGQWAELDEPQDFGRFVFGTKSQTLERLSTVFRSGTILPQHTFTVARWKKEKDAILSEIQKSFPKGNVVVRSSSQQEDTLHTSAAGAFTSVLNIDPQDADNLASAINEVIESYGKEQKEDQILVQPQLQNVARSGVLFTCDLRSGAPYYVINDDRSGSTDSITSGAKADHSLTYIYKKAPDPKKKHLRTLVQAARELEKLTGSETIDIEYAFDRRGKLYIFQTRPIASTSTLRAYYSSDIDHCIQGAKELIRNRLKRKPHLSGKTTVLGDMPDWNPAELIGAHPKPLARSLFEELIMKDGWRIARHIVGYNHPAPERLMVTICGHPYIDVRNSLNSYAPSTLPPALRNALIDEAITYLRKNPSAHDKLEFEVGTTCFTPTIHTRDERWRKAGLKPREITEIKKHLLKHTQDMIKGEKHTVASLMQMVHTLDERREQILAAGFDPPYTISTLLEDCRQLGTIPFSSIDRYAFIGMTFLKSFVHLDAMSLDRYHAFLTSIDTVASRVSEALANVSTGKMALRRFLKEYGHLRPGTFDIESPRYDEDPDRYFCDMQKISLHEENAHFRWKKEERESMDTLLRKSGLSITSKDILQFVVDTAKGREESKFIFSKNISDVLRLITQWGASIDLTPEDLNYLEIEDILKLMKMHDIDAVRNLAQTMIACAKEEYRRHEQTIMPQLITKPDDIDCVSFIASRPNFITSKKVSARAVHLDQADSTPNLKGKIVLIESADPGFDWIFAHGIAGLITKYGGAGSHMAIRCAEFDLPAAIGVGAQFENLVRMPQITLDSGTQTMY